jgi:uncharacterized iron-regulated membrane protein
MTTFPDEVWTLLAIAAIAGILGILHLLATAVGHETYVHDLRVKVNTLRRDQLERLRRLAEQHSASVEIVEDAPPAKNASAAPPPQKKAA